MSRFALVLVALALGGCATLSRSEEIAWQALHVVDMAQTVDGMRDSCVREAHPITRAIIGDKPSTGAIVAYGVASSVLHAEVSDLLLSHDHPKLYAAWQVISIADTGFAVGQGISIGIRLGAPNKTGCK